MIREPVQEKHLGWAALIAVLAGNALYFLVLWPYLPPRARHGIDRIDLGLLVDFIVCVIMFAVVKLLWRDKNRS